jgi:DNA-binding HxlR family transcriptional regulator
VGETGRYRTPTAAAGPSAPTRSKRTGLAALVVVQPDALTGQDGNDVQVDLIDQPQHEQLAADGGREHLQVLAVGRCERDAHRFGRIAVQERHVTGRSGVLGVMGEHEDTQKQSWFRGGAAVEGARSGCPINAAVEAFGDSWSLLVLRDVMFGNRRYFRELLAGSEEGIASNILAGRLKWLVNAGLLTRSEPGWPERHGTPGQDARRREPAAR